MHIMIWETMMDGLNGLPQAFCERMKKFMGDDYKAFLSLWSQVQSLKRFGRNICGENAF